MIRAILIITALGLAAPVYADPNPQLVASVQSRLNWLGFRNVDARTLSTRQVAALHLKLQGSNTGGFGFSNNRQRLRSEVRTILRWEEEGRPSN